MRRIPLTVVALAATLSLAPFTAAQTSARVPAEHWMRFADPADAGFDAEELEKAHRTWEALPSSAFLVVADGAVVAAWGDVERRFMCHSVRKSFLSALYGIYWDRGELELNKTLADLGLDDDPDPLLETEKRARILDLLKARSGVFHPAAYAGRTDSRPRGSEGPGRFFAYNNWDFNTLAEILRMETGADVFEAFDEFFGAPLGMEDWRVSDGYYHYERDLSKYPAYPFRMSARDAARFGLLFARLGAWGDDRILSRNWVRRSTALYSIDSPVMGYGFMWWVFREPRFEPHGMVSALGVGNQMIAALPDSDIVIVNRANTYEGEGTPMGPLLDLIESILAARTGTSVDDPELVPLEPAPADPRRTHLTDDELRAFVGSWSYPPAALGMPAKYQVEIEARDGHLIGTRPVRGTFSLYPQPDGTVFEEDTLATYLVIRDASGAFDGLADVDAILGGAVSAAATGDTERMQELIQLLPEPPNPRIAVTRAMTRALGGEPDAAADILRDLAQDGPAARIEREIDQRGYELLDAERPDAALALFELNTTVFERSANAWNSLAVVHLQLGNDEDAIVFFEMSLDIDPSNEYAKRQIERLRGE